MCFTAPECFPFWLEVAACSSQEKASVASISISSPSSGGGLRAPCIIASMARISPAFFSRSSGCARKGGDRRLAA